MARALEPLEGGKGLIDIFIHETGVRCKKKIRKRREEALLPAPLHPQETAAEEEGGNAFTEAVQKARPAGAKGTFVQRIAISSSMGPGVRVDPSSLGASSAH